MQGLEVSSAVRHIYMTLGGKWLSMLVTVLKSGMIENHVDCRVVGRICRVANVKHTTMYLLCVFMPFSSAHNMRYLKKKPLVSNITISTTIFVILLVISH
jgi:hypothetical protein